MHGVKPSEVLGENAIKIQTYVKFLANVSNGFVRSFTGTRSTGVLYLQID